MCGIINKCLRVNQVIALKSMCGILCSVQQLTLFPDKVMHGMSLQVCCKSW
jgi:hypothetical protein